MRLSILLLLVGLAATSGNSAWAQSAPPTETASTTEADPRGWQFTIAPYVWLPTISGRVASGAASTSIDVGYDTLFDLIGDLDAGAATVAVEARRDDVALFTDFVWLGVNTSGTTEVGPIALEPRAKVLLYSLGFGAAYRFFDYPTTFASASPIYLEALAGARWNRMSIEIGEARLPRDAKSLIEFVDPIVGGRFGVPCWESPSGGRIALQSRADIGGFGAGSDLSWNLLGLIHWATPWALGASPVSVYAGYKAFYTDVSEGSGEDRAELALQMNGPVLGVGFHF